MPPDRDVFGDRRVARYLPLGLLACAAIGFAIDPATQTVFIIFVMTVLGRTLSAGFRISLQTRNMIDVDPATAQQLRQSLFERYTSQSTRSCCLLSSVDAAT